MRKFIQEHTLAALLFFSLAMSVLATGVAWLVWYLLGRPIAVEWGTAFGYVSGILSAFAFAGVLFTVHLQREEIEHARAGQAESDRRAQLATYLNALQALNNYAQSRLDRNAVAVDSSYRSVEGMVCQAIAGDNIRHIVSALETDELLGLTLRDRKGSRIWCISELFDIYSMFRSVNARLQNTHDDGAFRAAALEVPELVQRLTRVIPMLDGSSRRNFESARMQYPSPDSRPAMFVDGDSRQRQEFQSQVGQANSALAEHIATECKA
jgi:DNA-binding TFAR19-related protein (PDSD5 family)